MYNVKLNNFGLQIAHQVNQNLIGDVSISCTTYIKGLNGLIITPMEQKRNIFFVANCIAHSIKTALDLCKNIAKMVVNDFEINGHDLIHGLGHSLGLEVHEIPNLGTKSEVILKPNMIITDEPGIYIPGKFGIRIEDTVIVGKSTGVALTKSNKEIIKIEGI